MCPGAFGTNNSVSLPLLSTISSTVFECSTFMFQPHFLHFHVYACVCEWCTFMLKRSFLFFMFGEWLNENQLMRLVCSIIVAMCLRMHVCVHSTNNRYARARQRERRWSMNDCSAIMLMMMTMTKPTLQTITSRHIGKMAQKTSSYTQYHNHTHKHF